MSLIIDEIYANLTPNDVKIDAGKGCIGCEILWMYLNPHWMELSIWWGLLFRLIKRGTAIAICEAHMKRMCGIDMGEYYNKFKKDNSDVKRCPQEKVEYIKEAFRYFESI